MKTTIGVKLGGCFFLTLAVLLLSSSYALYGIVTLRNALEQIAGDAWHSAENAAALNLHINQGSGLLDRQLLYQSPISESELISVEQSLQRASHALDTLKESTYPSESAALNSLVDEWQQLKQQVIEQHQAYVDALQASAQETLQFNQLMHRLELYGNYQISSLEDAFQRSQVTSWGGDVEAKWQFVLAIYAARIDLGASVAALHAQLRAANPAPLQAAVITGLDSLSDTLGKIIQSPLASRTINSGPWKGLSYTAATAQQLERHRQATQQVQARQQAFLQTRDQLRSLVAVLEQRSQQLSALIGSDVKHATATTLATAGWLNMTMLASLPVGMLLTLLAIWLSYRMVILPVRNVSREMAEIATGEGDLRVRLPVKGHDEIAQLAGNFNLFISRIGETVCRVSDSAQQLTNTAASLKATAGSALAAVETQDTECDQAASAMVEITSTVADIAQNAGAAADSSQGAQQHAQQSCRLVAKNRQATVHISAEMQLATEVITDLAAQSGQVSSIIGVIQGIAEQTNLLALNAAIEAARAGDKGRGFAVVADEVRALSHRTRQATEEIKTLLEGLLIKAHKAVEVMQEGQGLADENVQLSEQVQQLIETVSQEINRISQLNLLIATATEQQAQVSSLTRDNLERINQASSDTAAAARSNSTLSRSLEEQAVQLKGILLQFKV